MGKKEGNKRSSILGGLVWSFAERFLAQGMSLVVSIVLARILSPDDYGIISLVLVFISFADIFVNSGFASSLIQKKDATEEDFSTIFYCSLFCGVIIYFIIFVSAPFIAKIYKNDFLAIVLRVFALRIPISVYNAIQHAYVSRNMLFKRFFYSTLFGTILSGVIGIGLAYIGFGVWALVAQYFINTIVDTIVLAITVKWHPRWMFSWKSAKPLMKFGSRVLFADLSGAFFGHLRSLIIGGVYTTADLAYYERGSKFPSYLTSNISAAVTNVLFPAISEECGNVERIQQIVRKSTATLTYIMFPIMMGLAIIAEPFVYVIYTEKWSFCVPYIQLFCLDSAIGLMSVTALEAVKSIGRSDVLFKLEFVKKPVFLLLLIIGVRRGVMAIAVTMVIYEMYGTLVNMNQLNKYLGFTWKEQFRCIYSSILLSIAMGIVVKSVPMPFDNMVVTLIFQVLIGILAYVIMSMVFRVQSFAFLLESVKKIFLKNIKNEKGEK